MLPLTNCIAVVPGMEWWQGDNMGRLLTITALICCVLYALFLGTPGIPSHTTAGAGGATPGASINQHNGQALGPTAHATPQQQGGQPAQRPIATPRPTPTPTPTPVLFPTPGPTPTAWPTPVPTPTPTLQPT